MFAQVPPICVVTAGVKYHQFPNYHANTAQNSLSGVAVEAQTPDGAHAGRWAISVWDLRPMRFEAGGAVLQHVGRRHAIISNLLASSAGVCFI